MNRHVSRFGVVLLVLFLAAGGFLLTFFSASFGGPALRTTESFELRATVPDSQGLSVRSDVRMRGVLVGHVRHVGARGARSTLTLALDREDVVPRRGTTLRVGTKTALGESYVDLVPGSPRAPRLRSGAVLPASAVRSAVEVDEALQALDAPTRERLARTVRVLGRASASPRTPVRVSGAVTGLRRAVDEVHGLATLLRDQDGALARVVAGAGRVVDELAARTDAVRSLVRDGRRILETVGARDDGLRATVTEAPRLLRSARSALHASRPLLREARPVVADARSAAPDVAAAAGALPSAARDADAILRGARPLERAAAPVLREAPALLRDAGPAARDAAPALGNLATIARWLEPRRRTVASWFSNTAAIGTGGDAKGRWARFFVFFDPATLLGLPSPLPTNAYPPPDDGRAPRAFRPGDFERLLPTPAPASPAPPAR